MSANINGLLLVIGIFGGLLIMNLFGYLLYVCHKKSRNRNDNYQIEELFLTDF
jgi:hypothetical protein